MNVPAERCRGCGRTISDQSSDLAGRTWDMCICAKCGRQRLLADGGLSLTLRARPDGGKFDLGEIQIRPGAVQALAESGDHYWEFLARHVRGDGGQFEHIDDADDARVPFLAGSGNIVSEYRTLRGVRLWIMTTPGKLTSVMAAGEF